MDSNKYDVNLTENTGIPENDWVSLSTPSKGEPVTTVPTEEDATIKPSNSNYRRKSGVKSPVLIFQLCLCIVILTLLFLSKNFLPEYFRLAKEYFDTAINSSMISDGDFSKLNYSSLFTSSDDEA